MSCSIITAVIRPDRTIELMMSMMGAFSRVLTRLVEEQELRAQRVGDGHVEELALALREPARDHPRLPLEAELLEDTARLVAHGAVGVGEREELLRLAVAGEDGEGHVVERAELVEEVHELEAPRDAQLDLPVDGRRRDLSLLEHDLPGIGRDEPADQVDEGGL